MRKQVVQQWMIDAAKKANACSVNYKVGDSLDSVSRGHILWALSNIKNFAVKAKLTVQDWWYGYGYGYGYGSSSGSGYSDGSGYGNGYGSDSGYKKIFGLTN